MCGIFGFEELNAKTRRMAHYLAFAMEFRGDDSWGASDGHDWIKRGHAVTEDFVIPVGWKAGIFHTRGASVGSITDANAHPFIVGEGKDRIIGIHNGGVSNHVEMNRRYDRHCEVDSEHIFLHMVEGKPLHELAGRGTIIWWNRNVIHLARWNFGDLEICSTEEDGVIFCSNREPIERAARMCGVKIKQFYQKLVDGYDHIIKDHSVYKQERLSVSNYQFDNDTRWGRNVKSWADAGVSALGLSRAGEAKCRRCHNQWTKRLICDGCIAEMRKAFTGVTA